ncbi:hypothetical protein ALT_7524 [Aspergillus lentulus]|uniref:Transcription factor domain-containing protein n=1 Tax=Aspergillus lentulus TaxID=293939 RepID=A0AAN4TCY1_ASPLE|nr:hypothetical protein CNMCM7927_007833 [Aspergillus lentulus]KAF4192087.1 hypothetical protein CNMCM8694_000934 [Aspergillus lentulus]GAQ10203.1 hypothetical protein ALT_7524 [Aspergillus lentulus]GFG03898.1 hypothetical protein IFM61392_03039 [Aspergillus lentulus]
MICRQRMRKAAVLMAQEYPVLWIMRLIMMGKMTPPTHEPVTMMPIAAPRFLETQVETQARASRRQHGTDLVAANSKLDLTYATIPGPCKLRPMSESQSDPPSVVFQVTEKFYMHYQGARILVNWKFVSMSQDISASNQSWSVVMEAALEILRLQHRLAEESDVLDASRPTGMVDSCFIYKGYFLAASIASFLVQHRKDRLSAQDLVEVRSLLEKSLAIWSRTNDMSREANTVVVALRIVLGQPGSSTIEPRTSPQVGGGDMAFSSCTSFFDDLPLMRTDVDPATFPSLPSTPMIDYWPQVCRGI